MRGSLTSFARRRTVDSQTPGRELTESERRQLPLGFDAVAEALVSGSCPVAACSVAGRVLAGDGASLGEALSGLKETYSALGGAVPDFAAVEAMSVAWSEATLEFLHDVSCEDPLTGLASMAHLRTRLVELYREAERSGETVREQHALVVIATRAGRRRGGEGSSTWTGWEARPTSEEEGVPQGAAAHFQQALRLAAVADAVRTVFSGEETVARLGGNRLAVLVRRTRDLGETVAVLRTMLDDLDLSADTRMWIEGLPGHQDSGIRLLGELARLT
jgi:GGDEF domain-containing protein